MITVPIDQTPLSESKATVIIFHDQGFIDDFKVFLDREQIGIVTAKKPLKFSVTPGEHEMHSEVTGLVDRVTKQLFEEGKTYYMRLWLDFPRLAFPPIASVRIERTYERESYEVGVRDTE